MIYTLKIDEFRLAFISADIEDFQIFNVETQANVKFVDWDEFLEELDLYTIYDLGNGSQKPCEKRFLTEDYKRRPVIVDFEDFSVCEAYFQFEAYDQCRYVVSEFELVDLDYLLLLATSKSALERAIKDFGSFEAACEQLYYYYSFEWSELLDMGIITEFYPKNAFDISIDEALEAETYKDLFEIALEKSLPEYVTGDCHEEAA
ncbi:TPA: hypothetical protein ACN35C_004690 [Vibrio parahaemolyticus]